MTTGFLLLRRILKSGLKRAERSGRRGSECPVDILTASNPVATDAGGIHTFFVDVTDSLQLLRLE